MLTKRSVYLDHSATTPTDPRVVEAMLPFFTADYGNSASAHSYGRKAEDAVETARETIAKVMNCSPREIIFTSGASESNNLAIRGAAWKAGQGSHLITTAVEHSAVINTVNQLTDVMGFESSYLPVDSQGSINPSDFEELYRLATAIVSAMLVNNEVGTVQPIADLADYAKAKRVYVHTDAVQAAGQLSLDVHQLGVDMMSLSAHKFYGPKGVGLLYLRKGIDLYPSQTGGSHEEGRRAGTLNTPGIVGMAKALELAYQEREMRINHFRALRDQLIDGVLSRIPDVVLTGHPTNRLPSHASFLIDGLDGNSLITHLDLRGVAASSASACKTGNPEPSSVLLAMGYSPKEALGSLRLTVGLQTSPEDIDYTVDILGDVVARLRKLNAAFQLTSMT
ncbi:MAG: aminotransferase class V-fold PLP-dependent enzyme [Anaerolineaceae bacterium]|nr:aminotransferase class V-fold PLP-dependent enzyme [Anaerolineaceae bacterium]